MAFFHLQIVGVSGVVVLLGIYVLGDCPVDGLRQGDSDGVVVQVEAGQLWVLQDHLLQDLPTPVGEVVVAQIQLLQVLQAQ